MKSNNTILVCGGAGYIGAHVTRALTQAGRSAVVFDDLSTGHRPAVPDTIPFIHGSVGDADLLKQTFKEHGIAAVIHLCACSLVGESVRDPLKYYRNNVANGLVLLQTMHSSDIRTIVFSSTAATYGNPQFSPLTEDHPTCPVNPYGSSKLAFERMLHDFGQAYGLRWIALRYFNAAGAAPDGTIGEDHRPETHLIPLVLKAALRLKHPELADSLPARLQVFGSDYPTPDGTCLRDYIHVCDLSDAHLLALDHLDAGKFSGVFNLGNGSGFSVMQVIDACRNVTGLDIPYDLADRRPGDPPELVSDSSLARSALAWTPNFPDLESIVRDAWKFHQQFPTGFSKP